MEKKRIWYLTFDKSCPLGFSEKLIYSFLVSKAKYGKPQTAKIIAVNVGLHRGSVVAASLATLDSHKLAEQSSHGWKALQPTGVALPWVIARKSKNTKWYDLLAYFPVTLPDRSKMTTRCAVVYWFLVSVANRRRQQKVAGIAKFLSIGWATAARAVSQLQEIGLIDSQLRPTAVERDDLWREGRKIKPKAETPKIIDNYRMSSLFESGFSLDAFDDREHFDRHVDRIGSKMRQAGYSEADIHEYIRQTYENVNPPLRNEKMSWFMRESLEPLFAQAERATEKNRNKNTFQGKNSVGLLKHLTKSFIARINKAHELFDNVQFHAFWIEECTQNSTSPHTQDLDGS